MGRPVATARCIGPLSTLTVAPARWSSRRLRDRGLLTEVDGVLEQVACGEFPTAPDDSPTGGGCTARQNTPTSDGVNDFPRPLKG